MLRKLLCAVTLASAALAGNIQIVSVSPGTKVFAGETITVELERSGSEIEIVTEIGVYVGFKTDDLGGLGNIIYNGKFAPKSTDANGNGSQNITLTSPNWTNGHVNVSFLHIYLEGPGVANNPVMELCSIALDVHGATG